MPYKIKKSACCVFATSCRLRIQSAKIITNQKQTEEIY